MKKIFQYNKYFLFFLLTTIVVSCKKDFLEITPKGKLIAETTEDYYRLLSNLDFLNIVASCGSGAAQVPMGDEVAAVDPYLSGTDLRSQRLFHWDDAIYQPDEDALEMATPMKNIYTYNKVINEVMDSKNGTDLEKKSIRAEALAGRAWTYFLLINYYGKPYSEATSSTDPGFPIITEADVTKTKFSRASVKEVYDFIIEDLKTAIPDLPSEITNRLRMSKAAGEGVLGKVYVFMGKYDEALPLLSSSIADLSNATIPVRLYNYNTALAPGGEFFPVGLFGPNYPFSLNVEENVYAKQFINAWAFTNNEFVLTPQTVALYGASDQRLSFFAPNAFFGDDYPNGMLRRVGPLGTQFGVVVPDLYLLRAECKARLNDLSGGVADVETLRKNRMPEADATVPSAVASDQNKLVKFILDERIREFAMEGYRWFDMRRLSVDPDYSSTVGTVHKVYSASGEVTGTYNLRPERYVLRFTQKLMDQNPGMENNP